MNSDVVVFALAFGVVAVFAVGVWIGRHEQGDA